MFQFLQAFFFLFFWGGVSRATTNPELLVWFDKIFHVFTLACHFPSVAKTIAVEIFGRMRNAPKGRGQFVRKQASTEARGPDMHKKNYIFLYRNVNSGDY